MLAVVIEDSKTQAHRLRTILERDDFDVKVAPDGESGLLLCTGTTSAPNVVISNVVMPGIDGYEVCKRLKSHEATRAVPVILLTILSEPTDVVRALSVGADNFITKPYADGQIIPRIRRAIASIRRPVDESDVELRGEVFPIASGRRRILDLLVSALEDVATRNVELEVSRAQLERVTAQREELVAMVAHELKTPLQTLLLKAKLASRRVTSEDDAAGALKSLSEMTQSQISQMVNIVNDLLDTDGVPADSFRIEPRPLDVVRLVDDTIDRMKPVLSSHELTLHVPRDLLVVADPSRLEQVLVNLLTNSAKYSPPGSDVVVRVEEKGGLLPVRSVRDQGIGVSADELPRVFERYFRTPASRRIRQRRRAPGSTCASNSSSCTGAAWASRASSGVARSSGSKSRAWPPATGITDEADAGSSETVRAHYGARRYPVRSSSHVLDRLEHLRDELEARPVQHVAPARRAHLTMGTVPAPSVPRSLSSLNS